jgi:type IV pilus assembly protein PilO
MRPLKPEEKKLIGTCVVAVLLIVTAVVAMPGFGLLAQVRDIRQNREDLAEMQKMLKEAKSRERSLEQLQESIHVAEEKIAEVERRLPNDKRAPELFQELNDLADIAQQEYRSLEAKPVVDKNTHIEIPLQITLEADYHNVGRYISMIENSKRFAKVDGLDIEYDFKDPSRQDVSMTLSTFMFVERSPSASATGGTSASRSGS